MSLPVYIAARFQAKDTVREIQKRIEPYGYEVLDGWLSHEFKFPGDHYNQKNMEVAVQAALEDISDVMRAQIVVILIEPHEGSHYGWLTENGIAIGSENCDEVWYVGDPFNVFQTIDGVYVTQDGYTLPRFRHFKDIEEMVEFAIKY